VNAPAGVPWLEVTKALAPLLAAVVVIIGGFLFNRRLERMRLDLNRGLEDHKSELAKTVERHRAELGAIVQEKLEASRQEATRGIEHLRSWLGEDVQRRLDVDRAEAGRALEAVRAELALVGRLRTTREEKRSDVAAEVLLATLDLMDAVRTATNQIVLEGDPDREEGEDNKDWLARQHAVRWARVNKVYRRFMRQYARAEVYLPDEGTQILSRARKLKRSIEVNQQMFCIFHGGDQFFSTGWGSKPQKEAEAMRAEVKAALRPHAQLAGGEPVAPAIAARLAPDGKPTGRTDAA
jgi:hypothetical protein